MWCAKKIEIHNLFANVCSEYDFKNNVCTVITGKNLTDKNFENNGAGKSTIFEAIALALTGDSLRPIKSDTYINYDAKSCRVVLELFNDANGERLKVEREIFKRGKSSVVKIFENGKQNTQLVSVAEVNKRILEKLGICKDDLVRYFIISQDSRYNFFTAGDSDKKEILNRITSANMVDAIIADLNNQIKAKEAILDDVRLEEGRLLGKIDLIEEQEKNLLENAETETEIENLKNEIAQLKQRVVEKEDLLEEVESDRKEDELALGKMKVIDLKQLKEKFNLKNKKRDEIDEVLLKNNKLKKQVELILSGVIECPKCGEKFILENDLKLSLKEAKEINKYLIGEIEDGTKKLKAIQDEINSINDSMRKGRENNMRYESLQDDIERLNRKFNLIHDEIKTINAKIEAKNKAIRELKSGEAIKRRIDDLRKKKQEIFRSLNESRDVLKNADAELDILKFWQYNMGKSGFQTYLANKSIKMLEGTINNFLSRMNIDYRVRIEPYKVLKSGDVRDKIDCFVSSDGAQWQNFLGFSGGERQRIILAGILALQKLINDSLGDRGLNLLLLDESLGNIDTLGTMGMVNILERFNITTMLITQNIEEPRKIFSNCLEVIKEDGISKLVY